MKVILLLLACLSVTKAHVASGTTPFATELYYALPQKGDNIIFSPLSVHTLLSLLYEGASGKTAEVLSKSLHVPDALSTAKEYKDIITVLNSKGNVTIELANKVYVGKDLKLKESFRNIATEYFSADVENLDFAKSAKAADTVNAWVRSKTHDKIDKLVSEQDFGSSTRAVLVNAIYFKGVWNTTFDKKFTKTDDFYISESETVSCEMMIQTSYFDYHENSELDATLIKLPYSDPRFGMIVILPNKKDGINELEKKLINADVNSLLSNLKSKYVVLNLPKFKIESRIKLNGPLAKIGLSDIFGDAAQFPNLLDSVESLSVSSVIQKAFIEVDEEGATATAATDAEFEFTSKKIAPVFRADHPFLYYIGTEINDSKVILFKGKLNSPK